jgi:hypothetical protein
MKQFKGIHEALIGESWKEITASQKITKCYQEAMVSEDAEMWETAIREEYSSLMENRTWELTPLSEGRSVIQKKWVLNQATRTRRLDLKQDWWPKDLHKNMV